MLSFIFLLFLNLFTHIFIGSNVAYGLSFGVIGDWGMGGFASGWNQEIISTRRYTEICAKLECNFTISVGDNFYCGDLAYCIKHSFEEDMKNIPGPFFACAGNHDNVGGQIQYTQRNPKWYWPTAYYTVKLPIDDTGYTVQIFALDTRDKSLRGGTQLNWLRDELNKSNARWKILFGHYPVVGSGRHKRMPAVASIMSVMKEFNAQVYFSGHDHIVEISNVEGRVMAISGGMSRGAMMAHSIGGIFRRFTLTNPSEYSPYIQPWGSHGFITVDLAPNTMNLNVWDSNGGMHYEFVVTHDWMKKVMEFPESLRHMWPPPEVVLQAMKEERYLPRGPGGGIVFLANGTRVTLPENEEYKENTTQENNNNNNSKTPSTIVTEPPIAIDEPSLPPEPVPDYIRYAVSTECEICDGKPRVAKRFTIRISGINLNSKHRVYLTNHPEGCEITEGNKWLLAGTRIEIPVRNTLLYNLSRTEDNVYLCLSLDSGSKYGRVYREDSPDESYVFSVTEI